MAMSRREVGKYKLWKETASVSYCPHDHIQLYLKQTYKELGYTTEVELANVVSVASVSLPAVYNISLGLPFASHCISKPWFVFDFELFLQCQLHFQVISSSNNKIIKLGYKPLRNISRSFKNTVLLFVEYIIKNLIWNWPLHVVISFYSVNLQKICQIEICIVIGMWKDLSGY